MKSMSATRSQQILALLAIAQLMGVLDFSIVNVALPSIQRTFHLDPAGLQGLAAGLLTTSLQVGAAISTSLASVVASSIALAAGGDPAVAATTGYQATLYLVLGLSVIAAVLAVLVFRAPIPVAMPMNTAVHEQQPNNAALTR